jgi:hypothetical protein
MAGVFVALSCARACLEKGFLFASHAPPASSPASVVAAYSNLQDAVDLGSIHYPQTDGTLAL